MSKRVYSHSSLSTFRRCPRQFKFQYIEKPAVPKVINADAYLGNVAHRVLKSIYTLGADGIVMPLDKVIEEYQKQWESVDRDKLTIRTDFYGIDDYIRIGRELLEKYYKKFKPFNQGTLLMAERNLSFSIKSFRYRGIIDRLLKRDDGTVEICDYKTGKNLPRPTDPDFLYQMGMYQLAVQENFPQFEKIKVAQYFLRREEMIEYEFSAEELDIITEELHQMAIGVIDAEKRDDFPTNEGPLCDYCDFNHLCPAKRHRLKLDDEKKDQVTDLTDAQTAAKVAEDYLEVDQKIKELQAEQKALRAEVVELVQRLDLTKLVCQNGEVNVRLTSDEKFITKTENPKLFAELNFVARQLELDDFFTLDTRALLKEGIKKGRVSESELEKLKDYMTKSVTETVRVKHIKITDEFSSEG